MCAELAIADAGCMRLVDAEFSRLVATLDRLDLWQDTVMIFTGDHGEMNGGHRMTQKGAIPFDEVTVVNLTVCAPGRPQGQRTAAVGRRDPVHHARVACGARGAFHHEPGDSRTTAPYLAKLNESGSSLCSGHTAR